MTGKWRSAHAQTNDLKNCKNGQSRVCFTGFSFLKSNLMSLRIEQTYGTHSVRSFDVPFWKTCAVRIENLVSKYFVEFAELLSPCNILKSWVWGVQWLYWSVKDLFFPCWMK